MADLVDQLDKLLESPADEALRLRDGVLQQVWEEEQESWMPLLITFERIRELEKKLLMPLTSDERDLVNMEMKDLRGVFLSPSNSPSRSTSDNSVSNFDAYGVPDIQEKERLVKELEEEFQLKHAPIVRSIRQERLSFFYTGRKFEKQFRDNLFAHLLEMRAAAKRRELCRRITKHFSEPLEEFRRRVSLARETSANITGRINKLRNSLI
jgi:hypothetical protein